MSPSPLIISFLIQVSCKTSVAHSLPRFCCLHDQPLRHLIYFTASIIFLVPMLCDYHENRQFFSPSSLGCEFLSHWVRVSMNKTSLFIDALVGSSTQTLRDFCLLKRFLPYSLLYSQSGHDIWNMTLSKFW